MGLYIVSQAYDTALSNAYLNRRSKVAKALKDAGAT